MTEKAATKTCLTCAESIKLNARKCTHCDSFQDWRRFFSFGSLILSLLIALISVITVAVPVIISSLTADNSDLIVNNIGILDENSTFVLSNKGRRPGVVTGVVLVQGYTVYPLKLPNQKPILISPDETIAVQISIKKALISIRTGLEALGKNLVDHECELRLETILFNGMKKNFVFTKPCSDYL